MAGERPHPDWRSEWQFARQHDFSQAAWAEMVGTTPEYAKLLIKGKRTGTRPLTHEREAYDVEIRSGPQAGRVRHIPARKLKGSLAQRYGRITAEQDLWRATWRDTQRRYHRVVFRVVPGYDGRWLVRMTITAIYRQIADMDYPAALDRIVRMTPIEHARADSAVYAVWPEDVVV